LFEENVFGLILSKKRVDSAETFRIILSTSVFKEKRTIRQEWGGK